MRIRQQWAYLTPPSQLLVQMDHSDHSDQVPRCSFADAVTARTKSCRKVANIIWRKNKASNEKCTDWDYFIWTKNVTKECLAYFNNHKCELWCEKNISPASCTAHGLYIKYFFCKFVLWILQEILVRFKKYLNLKFGEMFHWKSKKRCRSVSNSIKANSCITMQTKCID